MLYKGDEGVNDTVCPPEGGPAEAEGLLASNLPLLDSARVKANSKLMLSASTPEHIAGVLVRNVNVIAWLEIELVYIKTTVLQISYYTTEIPPHWRLHDSKSLQVSWTLLSILVNIKSAVI